MRVVRVKEGGFSVGRVSSGVVVFLACAAQFMVVLDVSVVNVALPSIQAALGFDALGLQWVVNGYALVFAGFLLLGGRLADIYGRKRVFIAGVALFSAASLVGGLAGTPGMLVAARAAQGFGAAILAPATLTILTTTFPEGPRRVRALAVWTAVGVAGGAAGNIIGGVLTQNLSWRWVLLINVPIGAAAILLAIFFLAEAHASKNRERRLDVPGAVFVTAGVASLAYGITQTRTLGWSDPATLSAISFGVLALAVFIVIESRFTRAPLVPLRMFRIRAISAGNVVMLLAGACLVPMWYFLSLFMQNVLGYGPLQTGVAFLPHTLITMIVGAKFTPWLMEKIEGRTLIIVGSLIAAVGFLWQSRITPDSDYVSGILGPAVVFSIGSGLLNTPITTTVTSGVGDSEAGAASGLMNTSKQLGGVFGLAALVVIAASHAQTPIALAAGYGRVFLAISVILIVASAVALALPSKRDVAVESSR